VSTFEGVWGKLRNSKKYRESFVLSLFKRTVPFQIKALRKQRGWSQEELARRSQITQGVVSRTEDQDYGNLTVNTICRVAAGFDVAFIGKFVPFTELDRWFINLTEKTAQVSSFEEEDAALFAAERQQALWAYQLSLLGLDTTRLGLSLPQAQLHGLDSLSAITEATAPKKREPEQPKKDNIIPIESWQSKLRSKGQRLVPDEAEEGGLANAAIGGHSR